MEEEEVWIPPTAAKARLRLMVLWANNGRAFLEREYRNEPEEGASRVEDLQNWVVNYLADEATVSELERHSQPIGSWTEQQVINDGWGVEAGQAVAWGLGLLDQMPPWDKEMGWPPATEDFFEFPDPASWRTNLELRDPNVIEEVAREYETRFWRIRERGQNEAYIKKLLRRANRLGHVQLANDGDLALSNGKSCASLNEDKVVRLGSIATERLNGLNWLCGQEPIWDDITADTIVSWLWDDNWPDDIEPKPEIPRGLLSRLFGKGS